MGGSPVRGPNKTIVAQLNHAKDIHEFQTELVRLIRIDLPHSEVFAGGVERDSHALQVPSWVRSHLEKHPGLRGSRRRSFLLRAAGRDRPQP